MHVSLTDNDSNVERFLAKLFRRFSSGKSSVDYTVEISNARIELDHQATHRQTVIEPIAVHLTSKAGTVDEFDLAIGNPPGSGGNATDWLIARYGYDVVATDAPKVSGLRHAILRASKWKLDSFGPLMARFAPNAELGGDLDADASIALTTTESGLDWDWNGTISLHQFLITGIESLRRDRLTLDHAELSGRTAAIHGRLVMHDLKLTTDVGEFTATGDIPLDSPSKVPSKELLQSLLSDEDYHIDGRVDLKKLALILPETLRIRDGIEITGGDVRAQFVGAEVNGVRRWSGNAGIVGLSALNRGQKIPWDRPLAARLDAHRDHDAIVVDLLECKSDFLQISGKGTVDDAKFAATGDLSNLLTNVERFVDLGIEHLSGQMKASGEIQRRDNNEVALTSKIVLDGFAYVVTNNEVWREQHMELSITASGAADSTPTLTSVKSGQIQLSSGGDAFNVVLQKPIDLTLKSSIYSVNANLKGGLASWQSRLRPFLAFDGWRMNGTVDLATSMTADVNQIGFQQLSIDVKQLEAAGPEWLIQDADMKLAASGTWDFRSRKWTSPKCNLDGDALTIEVSEFECEFGPQGLAALSGTASYRADMTKVSRWKNLAIPNPSYYLIGSLSGTAGITRQGQAMNGNLDAQIEKFIIAGQGVGSSGQSEWVALWKEPQLKLAGKCSYDGASDKLTLDSSRIDMVGLSIAANGKLEDCSTSRRIDLTGDLAYDWDQLMKRLGPQVSQKILMTGKDHRPFTVKGSLVASSNVSGLTGLVKGSSIPAAPVSFQPGVNSNVLGGPASTAGGLVDLSGQASVGWTSATIYGITAGAGDLSTQVEQGVCRFAPIDLTVGDGKLHMTPTIYLDRNPFTLVLPNEKLIDQIRLSPELCRNSLKLALPMLADAAQVDGKISLDLQSATLPLSAPAYGNADGTIIIHQAQARPGTAAFPLISAIEQVKSIITRQQPGDPNRNQVLLEMAEQQVPFKLEQGRVFHQGMMFTVAGVSVRTSGSVGIADNSLSVLAEVAIKDEWIGNKTLVGLKGKSIQIPIVGTISRPQIDPSVFANLAQQIGGSAIEGILEDKIGNGLNGVINNGLDNLLRGKK